MVSEVEAPLLESEMGKDSKAAKPKEGGGGKGKGKQAATDDSASKGKGKAGKSADGLGTCTYVKGFSYSSPISCYNLLGF